MSAKEYLEILNFIACCNSKSACQIKITKGLAKAIREIAVNLLYTKAPLTDEEKKRLKRVKKILRKLAKPKVSLKVLTRLAKSGKLRDILKPALRLLNGEVYASSHLMDEEPNVSSSDNPDSPECSTASSTLRYGATT